MVLDEHIEDLTIMADARREFRQPFTDFIVLMLSFILGLRVVKDAVQVVKTLELLNSVESGASAGIQLEHGKRLFEGFLGRVCRGINMCTQVPLAL
jgi:hypothetical protein